MDFALSVLDLSPISAGSTGPQALRNTLELARLADRLGYARYWLAEHHNLPGLTSSAPEILIGHVASETTRIRVGAGGIMLPNHAPLKVAEWFRVLEALHPGRIDLGIGRAPGTDPVTAMALRRSRVAVYADDFLEQLGELLAFGGRGFREGHPFRTVTAMPCGVELPPIWLLGSSDYSGQVAAALGTGFAFASHFSPLDPVPVLRAYRERFTPSDRFPEPHAIVAAAIICAETDARAEELASSMRLAYLRRQQGRPGPLPRPEEALAYPYTPLEREQVTAYSRMQIVGSPGAVRGKLEDLVERTGADEVMVVTAVYDHHERLRSYELLAEAFRLPQRAEADGSYARGAHVG